jgi:hypothetical protein
MNTIEEKILELWTIGHSTAKIAAEIGMSKNSVCGRIFRMRERGVEIPPKKVIVREKPVKIKTERVRKPRIHYRTPLIDGFDKAKKFIPKQAEYAPHSLNIGFWKLKSNSCRYVVNEGRPENFIFCGSPRVQGAYCKDHAAVCFAPPKVPTKEYQRSNARFR